MNYFQIFHSVFRLSVPQGKKAQLLVFVCANSRSRAPASIPKADAFFHVRIIHESTHFCVFRPHTSFIILKSDYKQLERRIQPAECRANTRETEKLLGKRQRKGHTIKPQMSFRDNLSNYHANSFPLQHHHLHELAIWHGTDIKAIHPKWCYSMCVSVRVCVFWAATYA